MTYLEMCQLVASRAGLSGGGGGTRPAAVTSQTGRMQRIVEYVDEASREIESLYNDWTFMRREMDFEIAANTTSFNPATSQTDVERINELTMSVRDDTDRNLVAVVPWTHERLNRVLDYEFTVDLPKQASIDHGGIVHFNPSSSRDFILRAEVTLAPFIMTADASVPFIPAGYHHAIVHRALMFNYEDEEAEQLRQVSEVRYSEWLLRLEERFLPGNSHRQTQTAERPLEMITI